MSADASSIPERSAIDDRRIAGIRRHDIRQFLLYGLNGAFAAVVYSAVVWSLLAVSHRTFVLDVVIAYAAGGVCNYFGARRLFKPTTPLAGHFGRYLIVVAGAFTSTSLLAWAFDRAGLPDLFGAYLPVVITALPVFVIMQRWVFNSPASEG